MKFTEFKEKILSVNEADDVDNGGEEPWFHGDDDDPEPIQKPKRKKKGEEEVPPEKEVKTFKVGDVLILTDTKKSNKLPPDAYDFLMTFKKFTVKKVNDKGKMDLGCHISKNEPTGGVEKIYMFGPSRFELETPAKEDGIKPLELEEED